MKTVLGFILLVFLIISFCGCSDEMPVESNEEKPLQSVFKQEYVEISDCFFKGSFIGKSKDNISIPKTNLFMENKDSVGFDYVSIFGINGTVTFTFENGTVFSTTFGTKSYIDKSLLKHDLIGLNEKISKELGVDIKEFDYLCPNDMDEYEALFAGKGVIKTVYETNDCSITLNAIGTNNEAVITLSQIKK